MTDVVLIGVGAIGSRHLQACKSLPSDMTIWAVEPSEESWQAAMTIWDGTASDSDPSLHRVSRIAELPEKQFDVAVVTVQANIRTAVLEEFLRARSVKKVILEKFLFQKKAEYQSVSDLLAEFNVPAWVNCPRRLWPGYIKIKHSLLKGEQLASMSVTGTGWDIGCNGVHFIDIFAFLADASEVRIDKVELAGAPQEAKRAGMYHISGIASGEFLDGNGGAVSFSMESKAGDLSPKSIVLKTVAGDDIDIEELGAAVVLSVNAGAKEETPILFQSVLTDKVVMELVKDGSCSLTPFAESSLHHLALIDPLNSALQEFIPGIESGYCPVT